MSEPKYTTKRGRPTTAADPFRMIWYSAFKACGFWTDDLSKLSAVGPMSIPCCPHCQAVGLQTTAKDWEEGVAKYAQSHPGYAEQIAAKREVCGKQPKTLKAFLKPGG